MTSFELTYCLMFRHTMIVRFCYRLYKPNSCDTMVKHHGAAKYHSTVLATYTHGDYLIPSAVPTLSGMTDGDLHNLYDKVDDTARHC